MTLTALMQIHHGVDSCAIFTAGMNREVLHPLDRMVRSAGVKYAAVIIEQSLAL